MANYLSSSEVSIYPSAYRVYSNDIKNRLNTEENFSLDKASFCKNYYTVDANTSYVTLFISGYRFTTTKTLSDLQGKGRYAKILLKDVTKTDSTETLGVGKVLVNYDMTSSEAASINLDNGGEFRGLAFDSDKTGGSAYLDLGDATDKTSAYPINIDSIAASDKTNYVTGNLINGEVDSNKISGTIVQVSDAGLDNKITDADHEGAVVLGLGNQSGAANQVVVGKYNNTTDSSALFIVGNGHEKKDSETADVHDNILTATSTKVQLGTVITGRTYKDCIILEPKHDSTEAVIECKNISTHNIYGWDVDNINLGANLIPADGKTISIGTDTKALNNIYSKCLNLKYTNSAATTPVNIVSITGKESNKVSIQDDGSISTSGKIHSNNDMEAVGKVSAATISASGAIEGSTITATVKIVGNEFASTANTFTVSSSGAVTAVSYNATSDIRKKENIVDYKPEKSILDLQVKKFDFIDGPKNQIGCIAQELKEICPEIVHEDNEGYLSIQETKLVYLLLNEVKKLKEEIKELKK